MLRARFTQHYKKWSNGMVHRNRGAEYARVCTRQTSITKWSMDIQLKSWIVFRRFSVAEDFSSATERGLVTMTLTSVLGTEEDW